MVRVKRGTSSNKKRKHLLENTKGFRWGRKSKLRSAKEALSHSWTYSFNDRRAKKGDMRQLQQAQINAASRQKGIRYSSLIKSLKDKGIILDRKVLSFLAKDNPEIFNQILEKTTKN
ncbi:MAG: 50S ribosomal protein L20 [bacterium]